MSEAEQPKRGRGRPRINPIEGARRNVTVQVGMDLYDELKSAADEAGLSISREMETRLVQSFNPSEAIRKAVDEAIFEHDEKLVSASGGKLGFSLNIIHRHFVNEVITEAVEKFSVASAEQITEEFINFVFSRLEDATPRIKNLWKARIMIAKFVLIDWNKPDVQAALNKELETNKDFRKQITALLGQK